MSAMLTEGHQVVV